MAYPYPIAQAERHQEYITKLMAEHKFPSVPVDHIVVISNGFASYVITGKNAHKVRPRVCKADVFINKIGFFEKQYTNPILTVKDLRKLSRLLVKMNTIPTNYILNKYEVSKADIKTGVFCPTCDDVPLTRKKQKWYCPSCGGFSKDAHLQALKDYFLLYDTKITNQEFREFVHLDLIDTAGRLLRSGNLISSGSKKMRTYSPGNLKDFLDSQIKPCNSQIKDPDSQIKLVNSQIKRDFSQIRK